jgi:hypothetical protein
MELYEVIEDKSRYILPDKYFARSLQYGSPKIGYIGEVVEEFINPIGLKLAIFKVYGFDDYFTCMPLTSFKKIDEQNIKPFISWIYLPSEVSKSTVTIRGNIIGFHNTPIQLQSANNRIEFRSGDELSLDVDTSRGVNKITIVLKEEGIRERKYQIEIRNSKKLNKEIKCQLIESQIFQNHSEAELQKLINGSITQNYFSPSDKIDSILYINGNSIVKGEFAFFLLKASRFLNSIDCQIEIDEEHQYYLPEQISTEGEELFTHAIIVNKDKFKIFEGYLSSERTYEIYIESLRNIIDTILQENSRSERTRLFTGPDGIYLSILTKENFRKLQEICTKLENEFEK